MCVRMCPLTAEEAQEVLDALVDPLRPRAGRPAHQGALGGDSQLARPRLHRGAL